MIKDPYVGMTVVPSDELRSSVKKWASSEWDIPKLANMVTPIIDRFDEDGKPYTVINVTKGMNVQIDSAEVGRLIFHPIYFDEYTKPIFIDYKRTNELI